MRISDWSSDVCSSDLETGATGHTSLDAMLATTTADAVIVTTPSGLHPNQTIAIARSGRHVVSEKPMATRWSDGLRMVRECDAAGVQQIGRASGRERVCQYV